MMASKYCRRTFLRALGAGAGLLPMLELDFAEAQTTGAAKRLLVLHKNNGGHLPAFFPQGQVSSLLEALPAALTPLNDVKQHLLLLGGIKNSVFAEVPDYNGHESTGTTLTGAAGTLTGEGTHGAMGGGISLDQYIAGKIGETTSLPFFSLNLAMGPGATLSWSERNRSVSNEWSPTTAFDRLFGGLDLSADEAAKIRNERKSILDYVGGELSSFGARLGSEDRARIERHLGAVRELERRVESLGIDQACSPQLNLPQGFADYEARFKGDYIQAMTEIAIQALICDATRVATFHVSDSNYAMTFAGDMFNLSCDGSPVAGQCDAKDGVAATYHDITHHQYTSAFTPLKIAADQWFLDNLLGKAIRTFASIDELNGTMLDNTVIVYSDDMANGAVHDQTGIPWILAGGAAGGIQGGRFVHQGHTAPHNGILVAVAHAMGSPVDTFGDARFGGILPGVIAAV
jgi:hypothetical protein